MTGAQSGSVSGQGRLADRGRTDRLSPAQLYLWIWGALLLVLAIAGMVANRSFATGDQVQTGHLFGVLETNGWHNLAGLFTAVVSLTFAGSRRWSRLVAAATGGGQVLVAALFALSGNGSVIFGLVPVDTADNIFVHLLPGLWGVVAAAMSAPRARVNA